MKSVIAVVMVTIVAGAFQARALQPQTSPKQAVVDTSEGTFVIDLMPDAAPKQFALFTQLASDGTYNNTIFHRMVKYGIVQGGDPLSKHLEQRANYGTGGLFRIKAEPRAAKMTRGSVAAVLVPGKPDSAGAQFFIAVVDQPGLDGQYTVFGHVSDGIEVVQRISETPVDEKGMATRRVEILSMTIRDTPAEAFVSETVEQLGAYRAVLDTGEGRIALEFFLDKAPNTVRQFMRMAAAGVYSGTAFHRVAPGFVIQTGSLASRSAPLTEKQQTLVHNLQPEDSDTKHVKGIVSMARGEAPDSGQTSFFICTGTSPALDGHYTAFARVVEGMDVVEKIEAAPRDGETPKTRIELKGIRIEKR